MAIYKRYQRFTKDGIDWSPWFKVSEIGDSIQYKSGKTVLKNEYKEEDD